MRKFYLSEHHFCGGITGGHESNDMSQVQATYKDAESNYGSELLNLVVAKGYLTKLLANAAVKSYIERKEPEILSHLELVANTVSMEEAVQQQQGETLLTAEG